MTYINIIKFALINEIKKDHSMIETRRLKNVVIQNLFCSDHCILFVFC